MNEDQWKGRIEIALGAAMELTGVMLHSSVLKQRGLREKQLGHARTRYGTVVAAVIRRAH